MNALLSKKNASRMALLLKGCCYLILIFFIFYTVVLLLGRVEVNLRTSEGSFQNVLLLTNNPQSEYKSMFVRISSHDIHIVALKGVDFFMWLGVALIGLLKIIPAACSFVFLSRFFDNLAQHQVFNRANANYLLYSGVIYTAGAILTPIFNAFITPSLVNLFSPNRLTIGVQLDFTGVFFGIVLLVAAYVFHYGLLLQDEADHTI